MTASSKTVQTGDIVETLSAVQRSPSAAALRMRRHRERLKNSLRCLTIELRETEVTALIRKGFLKDDARNDLGAVKSAFYGFLDRTLNS